MHLHTLWIEFSLPKDKSQCLLCILKSLFSKVCSREMSKFLKTIDEYRDLLFMRMISKYIYYQEYELGNIKYAIISIKKNLGTLITEYKWHCSWAVLQQNMDKRGIIHMWWSSWDISRTAVVKEGEVQDVSPMSVGVSCIYESHLHRATPSPLC